MGNLNESGYHTQPIKSINKENIGHVIFGIKDLSFLRYKQFEYHWFQNKEYMITFYFANINGLFNLATLEIYDIENNKLLKDETGIYLPWNTFQLDDKSMNFNTSFSFSKNGLEISYHDNEKKNSYERTFKIKSNYLNFDGDFVIKKRKEDDGHFSTEQLLEEDARFWYTDYKTYG